MHLIPPDQVNLDHRRQDGIGYLILWFYALVRRACDLSMWI